ncbi:MAG: hypothetical protein ACR2J3_11975, partial [Aridibacter sp.]
ERFNERKKDRRLTEIEKDLSLIAAALAFKNKQKSEDKKQSTHKLSRWAQSGRLALLENRL